MASEAFLNPQVFTKLIGFFNFSVGKTKEDLENFINEGVFQVERLKEEGWITKICYDDEVQIYVPVYSEVTLEHVELKKQYIE